jgi:hypothetical protein
MAFEFTDIGDKLGIINSGHIQIFIRANFIGSANGETLECSNDKIRQILNGKRDLFVIYDTKDESKFTINSKNEFELFGGDSNSVFGWLIEIKCDYYANKIQIDKFLNFMLECTNDVEKI